LYAVIIRHYDLNNPQYMPGVGIALQAIPAKMDIGPQLPASPLKKHKKSHMAGQSPAMWL